MNAVVKAGIGLVVVVGIGLGLGPYFIGVKGEQVYKAYLAEYAKHGLDVDIKHYNRTWFSASAEYQLTPNPLAISIPAEWRPLFDAITIKDEIQHGPLVPYKSGFKLGVISAVSHFKVDQEKLKSLDIGLAASKMNQIKEVLMQGTAGKPLLSASAYIGFDQRVYSRLESTVVNYQEGWGTLAFEPIIIEMDSDLAFSEYNARYAWNGFTFENSHEPLMVTMDGFKGREQSQYLGPMMWKSDGHLQLLPLLFKSATEQVAWSTFDMNFSSDYQDQKGDFQATFAVKELGLGDFNAQQVKWTFALNQLDMPKYMEVMKVFARLDRETLGANPDMANAMMQRALVEHQPLLVDLFEGIGLSIKDVELRSNKGNLTAQLTVKVGTVPDNIMQNPLLVINALEGKAGLNVDKSLIPPSQQEAIKMPVMMGFLKDEGEALTSALTLETGVLEVNGQQFPLGAMIAQNVQSSESSDAELEEQLMLPLDETGSGAENLPALETDKVQ